MKIGYNHYHCGMYTPLCDDMARLLRDYGDCFYGTSLVKHVPEYDIRVLRCYVTHIP